MYFLIFILPYFKDLKTPFTTVEYIIISWTKPELLTSQSFVILKPAQKNVQIRLSATITVKPCFLEVGRRHWGFGSENKRESTNQDYCQQWRRLIATREWISVCWSNAVLTWSAVVGEKGDPRDDREDYTASTFH